MPQTWPLKKNFNFFSVSYDSFQSLFVYTDRSIPSSYLKYALPYYPNHTSCIYVQETYLNEFILQLDQSCSMPSCLLNVDLTLSRLSPDLLLEPSDFAESLILRHAVLEPNDTIKMLGFLFLMRLMMIDNAELQELYSSEPDQVEKIRNVLPALPNFPGSVEDLLDLFAFCLPSGSSIRAVRTLLNSQPPFLWGQNGFSGFVPYADSHSSTGGWKILHVPTNLLLDEYTFSTQWMAAMAIEEMAIRALQADILFSEWMDDTELSLALGLIPDFFNDEKI